MAVKVGNSWVSEASYGFVNQKKGNNQSEVDMMQQLSEKFPDMNFSTNTEPFQAKGINNIAIAFKKRLFLNIRSMVKKWQTMVL